MKKAIPAALIIGGFLFILGTAGGADLEIISFGQMVMRCIIGLCAIGGGYVIYNITEER